MKTRNKIVLIIVSIFVILVVRGCIYTIQPIWWSYLDYISPSYSKEIGNIVYKQLQNKSSKSLLGYLGHRHYSYQWASTNILVKRQDRKVIPDLIFVLKKSNNINARNGAIAVLSQYKDAFEDTRIKTAFWEIINQGKMHPDYYRVLQLLAMRLYEPVYPIVLEICRTREKNIERGILLDYITSYKNHWQEVMELHLSEYDDDKTFCIRNLKELNRKEAIPYLEEFRKTEKVEYVKRAIDETIAELRAKGEGEEKKIE